MNKILCWTIISLTLLIPTQAKATDLALYEKLQGWHEIASNCKQKQPTFRDGYWGLRSHQLRVVSGAWETSFRNRLDQAGKRLSHNQFQQFMNDYRLRGRQVARNALAGAECGDRLSYVLEQFLKEDIFFDMFRAASDGELDMEEVLLRMRK